MMYDTPSVASTRTVLWDFREVILHHLTEHECAVSQWARSAIDRAGWTEDSYLLAALFDAADLLVEVTK